MEVILITGVNGYIGSRLARALLFKGKRIIGLDMYSDNITDLKDNADFQFSSEDIASDAAMPGIRQADVMIHCAALVHKRSSDLSRKNYFRINHFGTRNILKNVDPGKLKQIIYLSTVSVYGNPSDGSIPDEELAPNPDDFYGESKLAAEDEIRTFSIKHEIPHTILRLAPVYGKSFLLNIHKRIYLPGRRAFYRLGKGNQRLSLCSVNNIVDVIIAALNNRSLFNETFNIRDSKNYSINEIIQFFKNLYSEQHKPVISIIPALPLFVFSVLSLFLPKKAEYYKYQLRKIAQDSTYSIKKLHDTEMKLPWDLNKTFQA